ncbi:TB2-DP1-HVA22-related protein [Babesia duncani]|uniref:TB2-DP1-HVA22-related protein n=1 Tax=Babesia duncani TaxID=323732 RepID=A0AAD9UN13_9APIC|nr:TB2-DP1-HVA22-related protein [Babesia duncani]
MKRGSPRYVKPQPAVVLEEEDEERVPFMRKLSTFVMNEGPDWEVILDNLNHYGSGYSMIQMLSMRTNIPPGIILVIFVIAAMYIFATGSGAKLICDMVGFWYPAYMSYKVLKAVELNIEPEEDEGEQEEGEEGVMISRAPMFRNNNEELVFWIKYWVVFSMGFLVNYVASILFFWVPFLYLIKLLITISLFHSKIRGADYVYKYVVLPILIQYEAQIDSAVASLETAASEAITKYTVDGISNKLLKLMKK